MGIPDGYVVENQQGENNANNDFDSSLVVSNADGSQLERLEYIQSQIAALASGEVLIKGVADAGTNSTTAIPIAALAGFGNDFFNNQFYMQILKNSNNAGAAPEKQTRKITDYASTTGTFTTDAFSAAVEAGDICLILHESVVAIGSNNADNVFDSSAVAANADGSQLERLEAIKDQIDAVDNYVDTEVAAIKAETDKIPAFIAGAGLGVGVVRKTVTFNNTNADVDLFTVTGAVIARIIAICGTNVESAAGCNIGVDAGGVALIADTDCTILEAGDIWHDNSPDASVEAVTVMKEYIIANGTTILLDVEGAKQVDSGAVTFVCFYTPITADGAVAAAA
jgi:hypothetical protein